jgi:hypothetical protein
MKLLLINILTLLIFPALAHETSITSGQKEIRWNYTSVPIRIINNSDSLSSSNDLIEQSISEWNSVSNFKIVPVSTSNNQIKFSNDFSKYGSAVVGVTEINYNTNGVINTASIYLNEDHYDFTSTPGMPVGKKIYLKDVVTHELGHFTGLAHSEVLNSTMFYSNFPGQSGLAADDVAGIRSKYSLGFGKIHGYVKGGNHIGIHGVHVQAISRKSGQSIAGISQENGYFEISGLDLNDTYYLYTSPLKNINALSGLFGNVQTEFCPSSYVGSFYSRCGRENDGLPMGINLTASESVVNVGEVSINCVLRTQEDYVFEKIQPTFSSLSIFNFQESPTLEKSYVGFFQNNQLSTTSFSSADKFDIDLRDFPNPGGKILKIKLISQPFGNAVEYLMKLSQNSVELSGSPLGKSVNIPESTLQLDVFASIPLSPSADQNIFQVEIKARKLSGMEASYSIPDVLRFGSKNSLPYLLVLSLEDSAGPLVVNGQELSDNYSCLDAHFAYSVEESNTNVDSSPLSHTSDSSVATIASCATIDPPSGPGPGAFLGILLTGFSISLLLSVFAKKSKKFLS